MSSALLPTAITSTRNDMYAQDSIDLLQRSGIKFDRHKNEGIDVQLFGELLISSGLVLNDEITWISFHSGYDFGYLVKILTCKDIPTEESDFFDLLHLYFPCIYDVKMLMTESDTFKGGLNKLAADLEVERVGPMHQAGSDAMLTCATFFRLMEANFKDKKLDDKRFLGCIFGLQPYVSSAWEKKSRRLKPFEQPPKGEKSSG